MFGHFTRLCMEGLNMFPFIKQYHISKIWRNCSDSQILSQDMHKRKINRSLTDHAAEKQHKPEKYNNKNFP